MNRVIDYPGLEWCDDLRTYTANGGHINSRWYVTSALPEDVKAWYRRRLHEYTERSDGEWVCQRLDRGVRLSHSIRVHPAHAQVPGPRPQRPLPDEAVTVVTDETALFPGG